jgi:putative oxidoreductase
MSETTGIIQLIGRLLIGLYWIYNSGFHIAKSKMAEDYARGMRFPVPAIAGWPTGVWMIAAGLSIGLGIWPDVGALMAIVFAVPAMAWFHRFWELDDPMQRQFQQGYFWRNLYIVAASLVMFAFFTAAGDALRYTITGPAFDL